MTRAVCAAAHQHPQQQTEAERSDDRYPDDDPVVASATCRNRSPGGRRDADAVGRSQALHRRRRGLRETVRRRCDRNLREKRVLGGGAVPRPVEAESVRHHDQQSALVDEAELGAEEPRVLSRPAPEHRDGAEVVVAEDDRDPNREARFRGLGDGRDERLLVGLGDLRVEREEDLLAQEVVARRVAVGAGRRRRGDDENRDHQHEGGGTD